MRCRPASSTAPRTTRRATSRRTTSRPVAKVYSLTDHLIIPEIFVLSKVTWDKLSPADQALVKKFAREAQFEQRTLWDKSVGEYEAKLKAAGVEFVPIDNQPFYEATAADRATSTARSTPT